jgi:hypothetical protein
MMDKLRIGKGNMKWVVGPVANTTWFESCQVVALSGLKSDLKKFQTKATVVGCCRHTADSRSEKYAVRYVQMETSFICRCHWNHLK